MLIISYKPQQLINTKNTTFGLETGVASGVWRLHDNGNSPRWTPCFFIVCVGRSRGTMLLNRRFIRSGIFLV